MKAHKFPKKAFKKIKKRVFPRREKQDLRAVWQKILSSHTSEWNRLQHSAQNSPQILIATSAGGEAQYTSVESLLAVALTLRGANVHFLLCDQLLPACLEPRSNLFSDLTEFVNYGPSKSLCHKCFEMGQTIYQSLGLPIHLYSELVNREEYLAADRLSRSIAVDLIPNYTIERIAVGEHAAAGTLRFYARGTLEREPYAEPILRRYFKAALLTTYALRRLFNNFHFDCAIFHHGIYVPQGLVGEVARQRNVKVVNWVAAYRKNCFIFSHDDTYHHTMMHEPIDRWENMVLTPRVENQLMNYLKSRWQGSKDWIWFHEKPKFDIAAIAKEIGVDFSKPCIGMLTNVMWDAQLHYPANAFPNMLEWVLQTIRYFANRPDLQLLIRVHPAEIRGTIPSRQPIVNEIEKKFPVLPENIFIIPPESQVSTYAAMLQCDSVIIYGTKTGVELTSMGIPVIVAGEAWIRNKGITLDASSIEEYLKILDRLPLKKQLDDATTKRARKYAYHFFFRRMIPLKYMQPTNAWPPYIVKLASLQELEPGRCEGLDVICNGIMNGTDFIYPAECNEK